MSQLLRRIAINGIVTALILGVIGYVLADLASSSVLMPAGTRLSPDQAREEAERNQAAAAEMRSKLPVTMALWGFVFVVCVELIRHLLRSRRAAPPPTPKQPDEAEKLLEELMALAEAKTQPERSPADLTTTEPILISDPVLSK